jgi:ParB-like chromosome segregation protein Spo0J
MTTELLTELKLGLVPAKHIDAFMKANSAPGATGVWMAELSALQVLPGFNVRMRNAAYTRRVRQIADSIKSDGFLAHKPLAGYVAVRDGKKGLYVTDGHRRLEAARLANLEGADIERLPVIVAPLGTSIEDLTVELVCSNDGQPLTSYEQAVACKRLARVGWSCIKIASRINRSPKSVENFLLVMAGPSEVIEGIEGGKLAFSSAVSLVRKHGDRAGDVLRDMLSGGESKATPRKLRSTSFAGAVPAAANELFFALRDVQQDGGYASLAAPLRQKVDTALGRLLALEGAVDAVRAHDAVPRPKRPYSRPTLVQPPGSTRRAKAA